MAWHPLHERLSNHPGTLDEDLIRLGLSPHPRVVLALEGETEMYHAPRVWKALGFSDAPELMRLLKLRGVGQDLTKVAALAVAPLVSEKVLPNEWELIKPYTRLLVAVDPEGPYATPEKVESERTKILDEIRDVLKAQGVERPKPEELNELVDIRTWDEPCYEFAHFTDEELADAIMAVHETIDGWSRDELVEALGYWRSKQQDFKRVWTSGRWDEQAKTVTGKWEYEVSKVKLAEALWPTLVRKIQLCKTMEGAPIPPIVEVVSDAYHLAQQWRYLSFILTEVPDGLTEDATPDVAG
jgi:antitoxin component HigA of HigAB toxin-antitoxin module